MIEVHDLQRGFRMTELPGAAFRWRSTLRLGFALAAAAAIVAGIGAPNDFISRVFAPDGEITELFYVHVLRAGLVFGGIVLALAAARASRGVLKRVLLLAVAVSVTLAGLEVALRAVERFSGDGRSRETTPHGIRPSQYPDLLWENSPNFVLDGGLKFNSMGLRDDERQYDRSRPTIVVVGDSIESWLDLPPAELYPRRLETMLNDEPGRIPAQALNFGVFGYSLHQKLLTLKYRGLEWAPREVIVGYCLNDPIPSSEFEAYFRHRPKPLVELRSLTLLNDRVRMVMHGVGRDFHTEIHDPESASWAGVVADLNELGALANEHDFKAILLIFPLLYDTSVAYPWIDIHRRVTEAAKKAGITVVDLLDSYEKEGIAHLRADPIHPNRRGHEIAAERLYKALRASPRF